MVASLTTSLHLRTSLLLTTASHSVACLTNTTSHTTSRAWASGSLPSSSTSTSRPTHSSTTKERATQTILPTLILPSCISCRIFGSSRE
ncbi:hypothetical protein KC316_g55 [Hortaea werneckii]|nr:hypothetical protein KC316_g55 [Hortaea werneckii]